MEDFLIESQSIETSSSCILMGTCSFFFIRIKVIQTIPEKQIKDYICTKI